ncbi:uncharacterized protein [Amphiura filiformis]|uniref:uncharacterized protein n=1 Tax=Amphiura filiformis TaxID=82378 RepID=UPI003B214DC3
MNNKSSSPLTITRTRVEETLDHQLVKLFNHDFTERITEDLPEKSLNDQQFLADVNNTTRLIEGHYQIGFPLKDHNKNFPTNRQQAEVRAAHLKKRFSKNPEFHADYKSVVNDMINKEYAQKVPEEEEIGESGRTCERPPTYSKRNTISGQFCMRPLGFISPAILPAKQLMQELCKLKIGWDEEIPGAHLRMWQQWIAELPKLEHLTVDRCYKPPHFGKVKSTQLHHFMDASLKGYGTVSYLRSENEDGDIHCALVIAKARVAPVKQVTVPRLELNASTVAVRVNTMIQHELDIPINKTVFWTDSMTVLRYINNEAARFKTFVANRLGVIHDGSHASQWSSRGLSIDQLLTTDRWLKGPKFLWSGEEEWPACQDIGQGVQEDDMEVKKVNVMMVQDGKETKSQKEETVVSVKDDDEVKVSDMQGAEKAAIGIAQRKAFPQEIAILKSKTSSPGSRRGKGGVKLKKISSISKLNPFVKDGLLRVGGRLARAAMPEDEKFPVILPKESCITDLVMREIHEVTGHGGRNHMLSRLQRRFWIVAQIQLPEG